MHSPWWCVAGDGCAWGCVLLRQREQTFRCCVRCCNTAFRIALVLLYACVVTPMTPHALFFFPTICFTPHWDKLALVHHRSVHQHLALHLFRYVVHTKQRCLLRVDQTRRIVCFSNKMPPQMSPCPSVGPLHSANSNKEKLKVRGLFFTQNGL